MLIVRNKESSFARISEYSGIASSPKAVLKVYKSIFWKKVSPSTSSTIGSSSIFNTTKQTEKTYRKTRYDTIKGQRSLIQRQIICTKKPYSSNILTKNINFKKAIITRKSLISEREVTLCSKPKNLMYSKVKNIENNEKSTRFHPMKYFMPCWRIYTNSMENKMIAGTIPIWHKISSTHSSSESRLQQMGMRKKKTYMKKSLVMTALVFTYW